MEHFTQRELMMIFFALGEYMTVVGDAQLSGDRFAREHTGFDGKTFKLVSQYDVDLLERKVARIYRQQSQKG